MATPDDAATAPVLVATLASAAAQTLTAAPTPFPNATVTAASLETLVAVQVAATMAALPAFTPTAPAATFHPVLLQAVANASTQDGYIDPPLGQIELGGVMFDLPAGRNSVTTQAEPLPDYPTRIVLSDLQFMAPQTIYLLLTGGNTPAFLHPGASGRWRCTLPVAPFTPRRSSLAGMCVNGRSTVTPMSPPLRRQQSNRYERRQTGLTAASVSSDMLTIVLPPELQSDVLEMIEIRDESMGNAGSMDPALNLLGVTVLAQ